MTPATPEAHPTPWQDRFLKYVPLGSRTCCWEWLGARSNYGYGTFHLHGKTQSAHRVAFQLFTGPIPQGLCVMHICNNKACVNPEHLQVGTYKDNTQAAVRDGLRDTSWRDSHTWRQSPELVPTGEERGNAKLTANAVRLIRKRYANGGISMRALSKEFGVCAALICNIVNRKRWTHV